MKPRIHGVTTHWIPVFMAHETARIARRRPPAAADGLLVCALRARPPSCHPVWLAPRPAVRRLRSRVRSCCRRCARGCPRRRLRSRRCRLRSRLGSLSLRLGLSFRPGFGFCPRFGLPGQGSGLPPDQQRDRQADQERRDEPEPGHPRQPLLGGHAEEPDQVGEPGGPDDSAERKPVTGNAARARNSARSRSLPVIAAARPNSARASSTRPSLASRSPRTAGRWA